MTNSDAPPPGQPHLRTTVAVAAVVLAAVAGLVVAGLLRSTPGEDRGSPSASGRAHAGPGDVTGTLGSLAVLHAWDRRRSAAWARGDVAALRRIYLSGSSAGARDIAMLRRWIGRGLRVRGMTMQVLSAELRARTDRQIVLEVTDRLGDVAAVPVGEGRSWTLPRDGLATRRLVFVRQAGRWVLAAVYDRPVARTAVTSGSANS